MLNELPTTELAAITIIVLFLIDRLLVFAKNRKNNDRENGIKTDLKLLNMKMDNELFHIKEDITVIKERMYEIRRDISDIKEKLIKLDKHLLN